MLCNLLLRVLGAHHHQHRRASVGPLKITKNYSIGTSSGDHFAEPVQIIQNDRVHCGLSPTSGDAELLLLTAADYTNYINMQDYDYVNYVSYSGFVYSSRLDAGAYYILVYNIGTETAVGSITYWIDHEVDPAMVFFGISMACVFISLFAAVIVAARRGKKIKVWDARQGRNV